MINKRFNGFILIVVLIVVSITLTGFLYISKTWIRHQRTLSHYDTYLQAQQAALSGIALLKAMGLDMRISTLPSDWLTDPQTGVTYVITAHQSVRLIRSGEAGNSWYIVGQVQKNQTLCAKHALLVKTARDDTHRLSVVSVQSMTK